ncbi:aminodeoxychorismate synthase component I [Oceanobacillus damuensis]|uniref:aminodeoxychorismate synthase component I n=1 Tax=Oceanobacillus damuensis TaxID=937928 RepID=UPI00083416E3|nr:aminodeoxychorismate synthase component I [Oceanobacillus damuensis]
MDSLLHFNFIKEDKKENPLLFKNPIKVLSASTIEEVIPLLKEVEEETSKGNYAAGYVSYEAAPAFDQNFKVNENPDMPLLWFGIYEAPEKTTIKSFRDFRLSEWKAETNIIDYNDSIQQIKNAIEKGITYQVNYTIRLLSQFDGDSIAFYNQMVNAQAANYSAYLNIGDYTVISASPELFFHLRKDGVITTKPMKGTVGRGKNAQEDDDNSRWLYQSEKNRAENVMIVDLLRNDLGMVAIEGSVKVPSLYSIEEYPTVYQMTSTVTAEISDDKTISDIFKAIFPCGSITGAPKISTMNIINDLESSPRNVYCGAIGYITPEKEAIFNVPIRTVMIDNEKGTAQYGVGGGITWDSTEKEEYNEVLTKAKVLDVKPTDFQLLESLGLEEGHYIVLENHLKRMQSSAEFFGYRLDMTAVRTSLNDFASQHKEGKWKVRLLSDRNGEHYIEGKEIKPFTEPVRAELASEPISKDNVFLHHKTTNRGVYENFMQQSGVYDVLLWNEELEITEFTTGNIVVEINDKLYTPPLRSGLLPGTYREDLLDKNILTEKTLRIDDLAEASKIWLINSVRKWVAVELRTKAEVTV